MSAPLFLFRSSARPPARAFARGMRRQAAPHRLRRGPALLAGIMVIMVALAGCLGDEEVVDAPKYGVVVKEPVPSPSQAQAPSGGQQTASPAPEPSAGQEDPPPQDQAPNATLVPTRTYGTAPLTVEFELQGEDPEGKNITWTFDAEDDGLREGHGTVLPARQSHTYARGVWEAVLRVSDGNDTTVVRVRIEAVPPAPTGPPEPVEIRGTISGVWVQGMGYVPEVHNRTFDLPRATERITFTFQTGPGAVDLDYQVFAPDGRKVAERQHYNEPTGEAPPPFAGPSEPKVVVQGTDAALVGTWTIQILPALAVEGEYVIDIRFE